MQIPKNLDRDLMRWDAWGACHWGYGAGGVIATGSYSHPPVIIFDTEEVVFTMPGPGPNYRFEYRALGFEVVSTGDRNFPMLTTIEGEPVAKAWLNQDGQTTLLIDYETGRAVNVNSIASSSNANIPTRFHNRRVAAYFAGPGQPPVGGQPIAMMRPLRQHPDKALVEHVEDIHGALRAEVALSGEPLPYPAEYNQAKRSYDRGPLPIEVIRDVESPAELSDPQRYRLYHSGVSRYRQDTPYLRLAS